MPDNSLEQLVEDALSALQQAVQEHRPRLELREVGTINSVSKGVAWISGLPGASSEELILFPGGKLGMAFNLDENQLAAVLLDESEQFAAGQEVRRTGRIMDVPVGRTLLGRVLDPMGRPLDGQGEIEAEDRRPIEQPAPRIMDRAPVTVPLQTGIQSVDALIPIGRGQRELVLGDRQTGKTAIAVDTIINQRDKDVLSIYCAIGQRSSSVAKVIADLREHRAMQNSIVVVATGEDPPGMNYVAPYAATTIAEYFMEQGKDALVVFDDLTRHARSYRELSLLLRRPPAREAYPGDIFYIHSRLLERSTHLRSNRGGGSLTALPIIETQAENISSYIPTNLISITDGQIYLSPRLYREAILPPVDVGKSVSRVGGKTQAPAYRAVAGDLRLAYSQFEELETFARFGVQLDEDTRRRLERGRRVREILKQPQYSPIPMAEQIVVLVALNEGVFDPIPIPRIAESKAHVRARGREQLSELFEKIERDEKLTAEDIKEISRSARKAVGLEQEPEKAETNDGTAGDAEAQDQQRPGPALGGANHEIPGRGQHSPLRKGGPLHRRVQPHRGAGLPDTAAAASRPAPSTVSRAGLPLRNRGRRFPSRDVRPVQSAARLLHSRPGANPGTGCRRPSDPDPRPAGQLPPEGEGHERRQAVSHGRIPGGTGPGHVQRAPDGGAVAGKRIGQPDSLVLQQASKPRQLFVLPGYHVPALRILAGGAQEPGLALEAAAHLHNG
jgi:F-type H+-transporting ATPase subunit alpha